MKKTLIYILPGILALTACQQNPNTGEMEPKWVFWVFLGLIALGLIFGVVYSSMKKRNNINSDSEEPTKTEKEIENYKNALEQKEKETEERNQKD